MTEDRTWTDLTAAAVSLEELATVDGQDEVAAIRVRLLELAGEAEAHV